MSIPIQRQRELCATEILDLTLNTDQQVWIDQRGAVQCSVSHYHPDIDVDQCEQLLDVVVSKEYDLLIIQTDRGAVAEIYERGKLPDEHQMYKEREFVAEGIGKTKQAAVVAAVAELVERKG